jgi:hypothetical protein
VFDGGAVVVSVVVGGGRAAAVVLVVGGGGAVDVGGGAAVDVGEIVVVAFDADVASEHASSFVVASYAVAAAAAVVSVRLLSFYFGESKNSWNFWI